MNLGRIEALEEVVFIFQCMVGKVLVLQYDSLDGSQMDLAVCPTLS